MIAALTTIPVETARPVLQYHLPAAIPQWLVVLLVMVAAAVVIGLYLAQRRLASKGLILLLLGLRLLVLFLVLVIVFQPSIIWTNVQKSPGTLWLAVDDSMSMSLRDTQASAVEKLRWADALGLLPDKRKSKPDVLYARAYALERMLTALRPAVGYDGSSSGSDADRAEVKAFIDQMRDYARKVNTLADDIKADGEVESRSGMTQKMRDTARLVEEGARLAEGDTSLRSAVLRFRWDDIRARLTLDSGQLGVLADSLDRAYLASHARDSTVQGALARVSSETRAELAADLLTSGTRDKSEMSKMIGQFRTRLISFGDGAQNVGELEPGTSGQTIRGALQPEGKSTNIGAALQLIADQTAPGEKASVVLVTGGRQNVPGEPGEMARNLAQRGVRVFGLLVGSRERSADAAVDHVDAPDWIFKEDTLKVQTTIRMDGLAGKSTTVQFLRGGVVVDTQAIEAKTDKESPRLNFKDKPGEPGVYDYQIRVAQVDGEVNINNNHQEFRVAVKKDKLAAILVEDTPRWEFQYLANFLARDQRMNVQTVLFTPAHIERVTPPPPVKASPANPRREAQILPQTREEWQAFDIIILGDVSPEQLPPAQQQFIATAVRDRGSTVIFIAGPRAMPARYAESPLADLLPVKMSSPWNADNVRAHLLEGFRPGIAPQGAQTVLSQLGMDSSSSAQAWSAMPPWYWHSELTQAKDAASVLWTITDPGDAAGATAEGSRKRALLASMAVGRGHVLYLASDQTWRMRQIQGDNLQDRFWGQVIRWATGTSLPAGGRYVRFGAEPQHAIQGTPVTVTARVFHENLTPYVGLTFEAVASMKGGQVVDHAAMKESAGDPGTYTGTFAGLPAGDIEITLSGEAKRLMDDDPSVTLRSMVVQIEPQLDLEQRDVDTYPELLENIANAGGGVSLNGPYADVLALLVPPEPVVRTTTRTLGLFADPESKFTFTVFGHVFTVLITFVLHAIMLGFFVVILAVEWSLRKRAGML